MKIKSLVVVLISMVMFSFMNKEKKIQQTTEEGKFIHSVYFWLANPNSEEDRYLFLNSMNEYVSHSPYVLSYHIGLPANTPREVVDNSYHYSLIVKFKSIEEHEKYQLEEAHKKLREKTAGLWEKIKIYDSVLLD